MKTIEISSVGLIKDHAHLGGKLQVVVQMTDGTYRVVVDETADDGPISHYVSASGIAQSPERDL